MTVSALVSRLTTSSSTGPREKTCTPSTRSGCAVHDASCAIGVNEVLDASTPRAPASHRWSATPNCASSSSTEDCEQAGAQPRRLLRNRLRVVLELRVMTLGRIGPGAPDAVESGVLVGHPRRLQCSSDAHLAQAVTQRRHDRRRARGVAKWGARRSRGRFPIGAPTRSCINNNWRFRQDLDATHLASQLEELPQQHVHGLAPFD